jgi:hypothetical protein
MQFSSSLLLPSCFLSLLNVQTIADSEELYNKWKLYKLGVANYSVFTSNNIKLNNDIIDSLQDLINILQLHQVSMKKKASKNQLQQQNF